MIRGLDTVDGKVVRGGLSVLRPEYIILFKAKAFLDLSVRRKAGEIVDSSDIKKHKKDILRLSAELMMEPVQKIPETVRNDIHTFINSLEQEPFDENLLKSYGLKNAELIELLNSIFD